MKNKRSHGMKKFLAAIAVIVGVFSLFVYMNTPSKQRMNEELKKPEVVKLIEDNLKEYDKDAFTGKGIIKTYEIDYNETNYNPMGGISFTIYINGDRNLNIQDTLNKYSSGYSLGAKLISEELSDLLRER